MTKEPTCCTVSDPISRAAQVMKDEDVGAIPVVEDEAGRKLVGIVTDRDLVLQVIAEGKDYNTKVGDVMSRNPVTCRPDDNLQNALDRMSQHQIRRIPVVDGKDRVVGIISQADVLEDISQPTASR